MAITDKISLPATVFVCSASPSEVRLVEKTIIHRFTKETPEILIGDKAYDSGPLDQLLRRTYDITMVAPHKVNRVAKQTQDGRQLRRYKRRWKVERFNAWIQSRELCRVYPPCTIPYFAEIILRWVLSSIL